MSSQALKPEPGPPTTRFSRDTAPMPSLAMADGQAEAAPPERPPKKPLRVKPVPRETIVRLIDHVRGL